MSKKVTRHSWEDALIEAEVVGVIPASACHAGLRIAKVITDWPSSKGSGKTAELKWGNGDAALSVGISPKTWKRARKVLIDNGFGQMRVGHEGFENFFPTLPPDFANVRKQYEADQAKVSEALAKERAQNAEYQRSYRKRQAEQPSTSTDDVRTESSLRKVRFVQTSGQNRPYVRSGLSPHNSDTYNSDTYNSERIRETTADASVSQVNLEVSKLGEELPNPGSAGQTFPLSSTENGGSSLTTTDVPVLTDNRDTTVRDKSDLTVVDENPYGLLLGKPEWYYERQAKDHHVEATYRKYRAGGSEPYDALINALEATAWL